MEGTPGLPDEIRGINFKYDFMHRSNGVVCLKSVRSAL